MAYDKKEQKAKGVKGIAANGELETLEANETNKSQFIRVDRYGNFFTNFGKNFLYQYNNPTRFSLYRMEENTPVEQAAKKIEEAKKICARCVVREQCLAWALEAGQDHGVWGGLSEDERRAIKRRAARSRLRNS